jgi:hypothetical protein
MAEYLVDGELYEVDRDMERAIIKRYLEKRYISVLTISSFVIGFLLGIIAYAL